MMYTKWSAGVVGTMGFMFRLGRVLNAMNFFVCGSVYTSTETLNLNPERRPKPSTFRPNESLHLSESCLSLNEMPYA